MSFKQEAARTKCKARVKSLQTDEAPLRNEVGDSLSPIDSNLFLEVTNLVLTDSSTWY